MPITSIELSGYKRLRLASIKRIVIQFTERLQLILGTNGCGKSSLMAEMSPLPANPADYTKDGYKIITLHHAGKEYVLRSSMSPSPRHSFRCEGDELNPGGTQTAQRELVKQLFGLTPDIHALLTNKIKFTQMGPADRRKWFTLLSDVSYDYALKAYKQLQERALHLKGAVKISRERLIIETGRIISEEEQSRLNQDIEILHNELDRLQALRAPLFLNAHELPLTQQRLVAELEELTLKTMKLKGVLFGKINFDSMEELDQAIESNKNQTAAARALLDKAVKDHEKLETQMKILKQSGEAGLAELKERYRSRRDEAQAVLEQRVMKLPIKDPENALSALYGVRDMLVEIFIHLPENRDRRFNRARIDEFAKRRVNEMELLDKLDRDERELRMHLGHMERERVGNKQTLCPKCGHSWVLGYSEERHAELKGKLETVSARLLLIKSEAVETNREIEAMEEYRQQYNLFSQCARTTPILAPFWDHLIDSETIVNSPRQAQTYLEIFEQDLKHAIHAEQIEKEARELVGLIDRVSQLEDENLADVTRKLTDNEIVAQELTVGLTSLTEGIQSLGALRRNLIDYRAFGARLELTATAIETLTEQRVEAMRREFIHESIRQLQVKLATLSKTLSEVELQKNTVTNLQTHIEDMEIQEVAAKLLVSALSPTDGLIAQGLMGSIHAFTATMNHLIKKMWSYPMEILPCGISTETGAELDYKFPMFVQTEDNPVPDVSDGSTGQAEMINLAFRIVAMRNLKLVDAPLMLDEFGAGFDPEHRRSSAFVVQSLIEQHLFSQVFMVSHYEESYGALTQREVCVLSPDNIVVPDVYNQHVLIET